MADDTKIVANRKPPNAGKGRPKGAVNKTTKAAKEAIAEAFEKMGGINALVSWASTSDDNRKVFYSQIWPKIVPLQVAGDADNPFKVVTVVELVAPEAK
ncbi:hypothetical protein SH584_11430 [Sphingomonas sp. LY29]|uniref:hypothetical protein n=1 Tax=Sphingomonas sp. LY29 TaxID=3095341 RepID=UPI002D76EF82|nr:hypothetical protein [Sphingomonas sp. LY29]WRP25643.1 hypothetical protein SH584_11430 [Sphingomonas sp. LY29]